MGESDTLKVLSGCLSKTLPGIYLELVEWRELIGEECGVTEGSKTEDLSFVKEGGLGLSARTAGHLGAGIFREFESIRDGGEFPSPRDWVCGEERTVVSRPTVKVPTTDLFSLTHPGGRVQLSEKCLPGAYQRWPG